MTDYYAAFVDLMKLPEAELPLDRAALIVAAQAYPDLDLDEQEGVLDEIATNVRPPTLDGLLRLLFKELGFRGNRDEYFDPRNSYLPDVLARRTGIPITLSIVAMEVGRRSGVPLDGIGAPGHFLLRDKVDRSVYIDAFDGGRIISRAPLEAGLQAQAMQASQAFDPVMLEPVGRHAIIARVLANLKVIHAQQRDRAQLIWVQRLRCAIPGMPEAEHRELAALLSTYN